MDAQGNAAKYLSVLRDRRKWVVLILVWLALTGASLSWNLAETRRHAWEVATDTARAFFQEIQTTRLWNATHGGVYVPVSESTKPNPYLDDSAYKAIVKSSPVKPHPPKLNRTYIEMGLRFTPEGLR